MREVTVPDDAEGMDLAKLLGHKEPSYDELHEFLWGVPKGQPIPFEEFDAATMGEPVNG